MAEPEAATLGAAWQAAQDRLPDGWTLEGLRCASTGLAEAQRSDDWIALATGPSGAQRTHQASAPEDALAGLAASLESSPPLD